MGGGEAHNMKTTKHQPSACQSHTRHFTCKSVGSRYCCLLHFTKKKKNEEEEKGKGKEDKG